MVCINIKRDPLHVDDKLLVTISLAFLGAVVHVMGVKPEDVEVDVRDVGRFNINTRPLEVAIESGPGKDNVRLERCREMQLAINEIVAEVVPERLQSKAMSNVWLKIVAKGASSPVGRPNEQH